jgi:hypothetical protein
MDVLFLHGCHAKPGGVKPTYLKEHGHKVINPALPADDFAAAVRVAQAAFDEHRIDVVVGSSRGGAVAMNINSRRTPRVLLCPAWKRWGSAKTVNIDTLILHSPGDDAVPWIDSAELLFDSGLDMPALILVGHDHRLNDPESLKALDSALLHVRAQWAVRLQQHSQRKFGQSESSEKNRQSDLQDRAERELACSEQQRHTADDASFEPRTAARSAGHGEACGAASIVLSQLTDICDGVPDECE